MTVVDVVVLGLQKWLILAKVAQRGNLEALGSRHSGRWLVRNWCWMMGDVTGA